MSAAFDYSGLLAVADRLIPRFGRSVTLRRQSASSTDPAKPWGPKDPTGSDIQAIAATAVFFDREAGSFDSVTAGIGLGVTNVEEKTARVFVQALSGTLPSEIGQDWQIDDGSRRYEVVSSVAVKPGGTLLYHDMQVKL